MVSPADRLLEVIMAGGEAFSHPAPKPRSRRANVRWGLSTILPLTAIVPASGFTANASTIVRAQASSSLLTAKAW